MNNKNSIHKKLFKTFLITFLLFIFCPNFAFANITITTPITSDTTWSPSGGVYIINEGFSVAPGITLTIEPGTIIKSRAAGYNWPNIYGKIIAHGTSALPLYN